ncbi:MFS transporter [Aquamicrobium soli]|jgi:MFS family permease|uniref:MFS transporter n=1 Tax=Aquamicrobium soli TaxID=1811518 RepID=A0ABV7KFH0_9HYPH
MTNPIHIYEDGRPSLPSRVFLEFLTSTLSCNVGRNGYYMATSWILVEAGFGSASVATLLLIVSASEFVTSPLAGMAADRFDRRRLTIAADIGRFVVMLGTACTIPYLNMLVVIYLSANFFSFCDRMALTGSQALIPGLVHGRRLSKTNSAIFFTMQLGCLCAALLTGPLLRSHLPALVFIILGGFFLISAGCLSSMRAALHAHHIGKKCSSPRMAAHLFPLFAFYALLYGSAIVVSVMGASFILEEQDGTALDFGYLEAAWSVGSLIGAVLLIRLRKDTRTHALHLMLLGLNGLALMALMLLRMPWILINFAILGLLYNLGRVSVEVALQLRLADHMLGRAKGIMHSFAAALGLIIFGIVSFVGDTVRPSTIFFGFGVVLLVSLSVLSTMTQQKNGL